ncbi:MAG: hypothetical protein JWL63_3308 [Rhodocyclales bacterium]|nr:hypothetical protein [Rhodocyclales bacterium]
MSERVRSTELRIHVKHVFSFGVLAETQSVFKHVRQAMVHMDHTIFSLHHRASDCCSNLAGQLFVLGEQLDFFFGEITVVQTIAH